MSMVLEVACVLVLVLALAIGMGKFKLSPISKKTDENHPVPNDKRAQLQRVRVDIAKMRLQEQKLEEEILDEQGNPVPNRRASGVSTND